MSDDPAELRRMHREQWRQARAIAKGKPLTQFRPQGELVSVDHLSAGGGHIPSGNYSIGFWKVLGAALVGIGKALVQMQANRFSHNQEDQIRTARHSGGMVYVTTMNGKSWGVTGDRVVGHSGSTITVRHGSWVQVYDAQGKAITSYVDDH
jgi:hypothetical protein